MINWEKLKENSTLEDFANILSRNKPHGNSKFLKEYEQLIQNVYNELANEEEHPNECEKLINNAIDFLERQKNICMKGFIYSVKEVK